MNCCIVKRSVSPLSFLPIVLILVVSVVLSLLLLNISLTLFLLPLAVGAFLTVYLFPSILKTEYEYNLEGDLFSVAIIKNNSKRKELFSQDMDYLVSCAPLKSSYDNGVKEKIDAAVKEGEAYCAVFTKEEKTVSVIFSPSEEFMKSMRLVAPLKVKLI